jgi:RHS repeat-associated protein
VSIHAVAMWRCGEDRISGRSRTRCAESGGTSLTQTNSRPRSKVPCRPQAAAGFTAATNAYRYTGKRLDTGSATLDMGARSYLPATGSFLQVDYYSGALANVGLSLSPLSNNRYALAGGNPVSRVGARGRRSSL